jgi:hypothetical protein
MALLDIDRTDFRAHYNRRPFIVRHSLVDHPLVRIDALKALAARLPPGKVYFRSRFTVDEPFDNATLKHPSVGSVERVFDRLEELGTSIQISTPECDPEYRPLIDEILADIRRHTDPVDPTMTYTAAYFFVAGPGSVTSYHMDREMNFLLHIRGPKQMTLWDSFDLDIMSEREREVLFGGGVRPRYRPEFEAKAMRFDLKPGFGLHHPFIAPHCGQTGDGVTVSLAVTYRTIASDRTTLLYRTNHKLRQLGFRPTPVGSAPHVDSVKFAAATALRRAVTSAKRRVGREQHASPGKVA